MNDNENGSLAVFHVSAGICLLVAAVLVALRALGVVDWDWFWCVFPIFFFVMVYIFFCAILMLLAMLANRK